VRGGDEEGAGPSQLKEEHEVQRGDEGDEEGCLLLHS
jgi:hypothetical protein